MNYRVSQTLHTHYKFNDKDIRWKRRREEFFHPALEQFRFQGKNQKSELLEPLQFYTKHKHWENT